MKLIGILSWILVFVACFVFAARNTDPVVVRFYLDQQWQGPLVGALCAFLVLGFVLGVLACLPRWLRQRREIVALKREARARASAERNSSPPPAAV